MTLQVETHKAPTEEETFWCGIHSGFPLCCIFWYLDGWDVMDTEGFPREMFKDNWRCAKKGDNITLWTVNWLTGINYVACPDCLYRILMMKQSPNKVKDCSCSWSKSECEKRTQSDKTF